MRVLIWHHHGAWTTNFVQGEHDYFVPVNADGRGAAIANGWPDNVHEIEGEELRDLDVDVAVLQRPDEIELAATWTGRRPGAGLPAVYLEHNTPGGDPCRVRHPLADQDAIPIVHVTPFNQLFWDNGRAPTQVIEHGVIDPGHRFTGEVPAAAVVVNEPIRRGRATGTDLLAGFAEAVDLDVYGMKVTGLAAELSCSPDVVREHEDLRQAEMHAEIARRRVYVHPNRWTSLGLSLIEAMLLGLPAVVLATTEQTLAVPPGGGVASTRLDVLHAAARDYVQDRDAAADAGARARTFALERFSLHRFQSDWNWMFKEVCR